MVENPVAVSQADRDAAGDIWRDFVARTGEGITEKAIRSGGIDNGALVQAFARHRLAGLEREADGAPGGESSITDDQIDAAVRHGFGDRIADAMASVSGEVVTVPKADRLVSGLRAVCGHTQAIAEYRKRVGDWSANDHDHLLISALDSIARICSHHLAGEPLAAAPEAATHIAEHLTVANATPSAVGGLSEAVFERLLRAVPLHRLEPDMRAEIKAALASGETSPDRGRGE